MVTENKSLISFSGMMGRKAYFVNYLIMTAITWGAIAILALLVGILKLAGASETVITILAVLVAIPAIVTLYYATFGAMIRRIRDLLNLTTTDTVRDAAIVLGLIFTAGFCLIGYIAILVWPGTLHKQSTALTMKQINKAEEETPPAL